MATETTRRDMLKGGLAAAGLGLLGMPEWALPALAQGETVVPFTDWPENFNPNPAPDRRLLDIANHQRRVDAERPVLHDAALRPSRWSIRRPFA